MEYNGQQLSYYDATQRQRGIERNVRRWKREYTMLEAAGQDTTEAAAKLAKWRAVEKDFCKQTGLPRDSARTQVHGFGRSQASRAVHEANQRHTEWLKSVNAQTFEFKTLAKYYQEKYNNSPDYLLLKRYIADVESGWISPLSGFDNYRSLYNYIEQNIVGKTTPNGIVITGQVPHFMQRVIGTAVDPEKLKNNLQIIRRSGVDLPDIVDALFSPQEIGDILVRANGNRSIKFIGKNCMVTMNPDTGMLIQTNLRRHNE